MAEQIGTLQAAKVVETRRVKRKKGAHSEKEEREDSEEVEKCGDSEALARTARVKTRTKQGWRNRDKENSKDEGRRGC